MENKDIITAIIEIPKGDDRRRHVKPDKSGFIDLGPTKNIIPINNGIMPVHYGYIPGTLNEKEGDEIDVLILSDNELKVGQEVDVEPISLIKREDGDDKVVAVDETKKLLQKWDDISESERRLIEDFFSYHHKFLSVEDAKSARSYIEDGYKSFWQTKKEI